MQRNVFRLSWFLYFKIEIQAVIRIFFVFCVRNVWRLYTYASFYFFFRFVFLPLGFLQDCHCIHGCVDLHTSTSAKADQNSIGKMLFGINLSTFYFCSNFSGLNGYLGRIIHNIGSMVGLKVRSTNQKMTAIHVHYFILHRRQYQAESAALFLCLRFTNIAYTRNRSIQNNVIDSTDFVLRCVRSNSSHVNK